MRLLPGQLDQGAGVVDVVTHRRGGAVVERRRAPLDIVGPEAVEIRAEVIVHLPPREQRVVDDSVDLVGGAERSRGTRSHTSSPVMPGLRPTGTVRGSAVVTDVAALRTTRA